MYNYLARSHRRHRITLTPIKSGAIYNYNALVNAKGIAPLGYHVPAIEELSALFGTGSLNGYKYRAIEAIWYSEYGITAATNETGFSAYPSGARLSTGDFQSTDRMFYLGCTAFDGLYTRYATISYNNYMQLTFTSVGAREGHSLRFIKDTSEWALGETVTDIDGNVYGTTKIGDIVITKSSSIVTHYRDGSPIPLISDNSAWSLASDAMCYINNNPATA